MVLSQVFIAWTFCNQPKLVLLGWTKEGILSVNEKNCYITQKISIGLKRMERYLINII